MQCFHEEHWKRYRSIRVRLNELKEKQWFKKCRKCKAEDISNSFQCRYVSKKTTSSNDHLITTIFLNLWWVVDFYPLANCYALLFPCNFWKEVEALSIKTLSHRPFAVIYFDIVRRSYMLIGSGNLELTYYMNQKIKANSTESKSATYTTFKWASI